MAKLKELSKGELLNFIYNNFPDIEANAECECAVCCKDSTKYKYICDKCFVINVKKGIIK